MADPAAFDPLPVAKPYWDGLAAGHLLFQTCAPCGNRWLPASERCPQCLSADVSWTKASGRGRIISWIVYHTAYDPRFVARVPYDVTVVELDEGPRLITNIVNSGGGTALTWQARVRLTPETENGVTLARFTLDEDA